MSTRPSPTQAAGIADATAATAGTLPADGLAAELRGSVILPGDQGYDEARAVWNAMIDQRPALIARCVDADDAAVAVAFGRRHGLPIVVRGGGHSVAGKSSCDGGLVIDLSSMNGVEVDADARIARVGPGARGADLDTAAQSAGLATTGGTDSTTGVIGLTLGGGMGFLARRYGLAADNLLGADVILADGTRVHASETEHPDLFWALRGGGGAFGIVTGIELQLHPLGPQLMVAQAFHPFSGAPDALRFYREFSADAPDEVGCFALAVNVPPVEGFPEESHGTTALALAASYAGPLDEGERALGPLVEFGSPIFSFLQPMEYAVLQQSFDAAFPGGQRYFWKSQYLTGMPDEAIETFAAHADPLPGAFSAAYFETLGGAFGRVDPSATAFPHRSAPFNLGVSAGWADAATDEAAIGWTRTFHEAMTPYGTGGVYANYAGADDLGRLRAAYGDNFERLRQVKERYDPERIFGRWVDAPAKVAAG